MRGKRVRVNLGIADRSDLLLDLDPPNTITSFNLFLGRRVTTTEWDQEKRSYRHLILLSIYETILLYIGTNARR